MNLVNFNSGKQLSQHPINHLGAIAGFIAPAKIQTNLNERDFEIIAHTASEILEKPLEVRHLADKVYQLLQADLRLEGDRSSHYRGLR